VKRIGSYARVGGQRVSGTSDRFAHPVPYCMYRAGFGIEKPRAPPLRSEVPRTSRNNTKARRLRDLDANKALLDPYPAAAKMDPHFFQRICPAIQGGAVCNRPGACKAPFLPDLVSHSRDSTWVSIEGVEYRLTRQVSLRLGTNPPLAYCWILYFRTISLASWSVLARSSKSFARAVSFSCSSTDCFTNGSCWA